MTRPRWLVAGEVAVAALVGALLAIFLTGSGSADSTIAANAAGLIERNGHVAAQVPISGRPAGVATGVGALWVTDSVNATLLRIDPEQRSVVDRIVVGSDPSGVAVGADSVWVANSQDGSVSRIDPANDNVATIPVGNGPTSVAFGAGSIWVLNTIDATISRLAPETSSAKATIPLGQTPTRLAFGLGHVWVTSAEAGVLLRVDPRTNSVVQAIPVGNGPTGIAVGDNAVWVANTPDRTISRVDPGSGALTKVNLAGRPAEVAYTDGLVWVGNTLDGTVTQIDADSQEVGKTIRTVDNPAGLASAGGQVWTIALTSSLAHRGGTLRIAAGKDDAAFDTPDPGAAYRQGSWQLASIVYDGLVTYKRTGGPSGNTIVPDLAAAMPLIQDGGTTYVFKLRKGIRYSNGTLVKPSDLRPAIERQYRVHTGLDQLRLRGSGQCTDRACDLSRGIVADDGSSTITFHLEGRDPDFLFKLALPFGSFIPHGSPQIPETNAPLPGTGPYMIKRFVPGRTLMLVCNPYFHEWSAEAQPAGYPDRLEYTFGLEPSAATTAVETGRADYALESPPVERLREVATRFSSLAHPHVEPSTFFIGLNTRIPPFDDVGIRRALNFAVDRAELRRLWGGPQLMRTTCQVMPPGIAGYRPYCPYSAEASASGLWTRPDLEQARRLIAAAGGARGTVTVAADRDEGIKEAAARYVAGLLKRLGFRARVQLYPNISSLYEAVGDPRTRTQMAISGWHSDFPRASDFFSNLLSCASTQPGPAPFSLNSTGFCEPGLDREMRRAQELAATDAGASARVWARVDRRVVDAAPWVAFLNGAGLELTSKRVANYQRNPQLGVLIDQLWVR